MSSDPAATDTHKSSEEKGPCDAFYEAWEACIEKDGYNECIFPFRKQFYDCLKKEERKKKYTAAQEALKSQGSLGDWLEKKRGNIKPLEEKKGSESSSTTKNSE